MRRTARQTRNPEHTRHLTLATGTLAALGLLVSVLIAPTAVPAAAADESGSVPVVHAPMDQAVRQYETATFTASIDRPGVRISWLGKYASESEFSSIGDSDGDSAKFTIKGSPSNDGLQVKAVFSLDGGDLETTPATLTLLPDDESFHLEDVDTTIGADAYFTILNADTDPYDGVRWQVDPAGGDAQWADVAEDADHRGTTTPQLRLSGDATALARNGDRYRAVFTSGTEAAIAARRVTPRSAVQVVTNSATLTVDKVTVTSPKVIEAIPGQDVVIPVTVDWPGYKATDLHTGWDYGSSPTGGWAGWTVVHEGWWGARGSKTADGKLTFNVAASSVKDWSGTYIRLLFYPVPGDKAHFSAPILIAGIIPTPDISIPADATLKSGTGVTFAAKAPASAYTMMQWQKQAPEDTGWRDVTPVQVQPIVGTDLTAQLTLASVAMADNGTRYRPVFYTDAGTMQPGRTATLTVTPVTELDGIVYSTDTHAFRYYVKGVDQQLNGMQTIGDKRYFFRNGNLVLGYVDDPGVPGGHAYFSVADGMASSELRYKPQALRYFGASGAMRTTAGTETINGKNYSFDSNGDAVQIVSEQKLSLNSGPGAIRMRVVEVDGAYTKIDFAVASPGHLGGDSTDKAVIQVGDQSFEFTMDENAEVVVPQLKERFRDFAGQDNTRVLRATLTIDDAQKPATYDATCPAPAARTTRTLPDVCPWSTQEDDIAAAYMRQRVNEIFTADTAALQAMTPTQVEAALGSQLTEQVRENVQQAAEDPTFVDQDITNMNWHYIPLTRFETAIEQRMVQPVLTRIYADVDAAFRTEFGTAIDHFNAGETAALQPVLARIRTAVQPSLMQLEQNIPVQVRRLARVAVTNTVGAVDAYGVQVRGAYLAFLNRDATATDMADAVAADERNELAWSYEIDLEARTERQYGTYEMMAAVLQRAPATDADGTRNTFTLASLMSAATQVYLNLPDPDTGLGR